MTTELTFTGVNEVGEISVGHSPDRVFVAVEGPHSSRAIILLTPATAWRLGTSLREQSTYAEDRDITTPTRELKL